MTCEYEDFELARVEASTKMRGKFCNLVGSVGSDAAAASTSEVQTAVPVACTCGCVVTHCDDTLTVADYRLKVGHPDTSCRIFDML